MPGGAGPWRLAAGEGMVAEASSKHWCGLSHVHEGPGAAVGGRVTGPAVSVLLCTDRRGQCGPGCKSRLH